MSRLQRVLVGGVVLCAAIAVGWWWLSARAAIARDAKLASPRVWPVLPRVVAVEVLNTTDVAGLARVGTLELRAAGLDVKYYGGAEAALRTKPVTRVLVRAHDTTGVGRVREVLGNVPVEDAPAPNRLVDLTVILGDDYHGLARKR